MNLSRDRAKRVVFLLQEADRLLTRRGWCQFRRNEKDGSICLIGALELASVKVHPAARGFAYGMALDILREVTGISANWRLPNWNDLPDRSVEDVHLALKKGIKQVEEMVR